MRAFLAFELSPEVIQNLVRLQEEVEKTRADVNLVGKDNIHITVKFFGEIPEDAVQEIDRRVAALSLVKMEVQVRGMGAFPDERRPRVIWAGISKDDSVKVTESAVRIIRAVDGIGQPEDRQYHPHVTLGRVRSPRNKEALAQLIDRERDREYGRTVIQSLKLKSSVLTPKGPNYSDVREYELK